MTDKVDNEKTNRLMNESINQPPEKAEPVSPTSF